ncbi:MAG: HAMP domain-containing protein [Gammaproteobacteria bacterium]|nr:MAG: HAMP domain-containing protein [Gammaproteobacteria bacterium]
MTAMRSLPAMRASLARLRSTLWPDPASTSLGWWLVAIHLLLVLVVAGGLSWYARGMLRDLADEQAKARVQLAATTAREDLRRMGEDALAAARALAERPTLQRLTAEGQSDALPPFLRRACEASGMDACALLSGKTVIAVSGPGLDWPQLVTASAEQSATFMALPLTERMALLGARAPFGQTGQHVYVVRRLDQRLERALSAQVGADIRLIDYRAYTASFVNAFTPLYSAALADGHSAVQRIASQEVYACAVPVFASSGEAIALIEALLPTDAVDAPTRHLVAAATRLAAGDFSASIPPGGAAEVGALARTMETMRRNLIDLTTTLRRREAEAQAVLGGIVEGVYAVDRNRMIRYLNPQAARLLGVTTEQVVGRFCGDVLKPREADGRRPCDVRCPILEARTAGSARAIEHLLGAGAGEPRTAVITSAAPVEGLQVQVIRDESELEAVRRARDSVLANISHEFRTPLAAQLASIELLLEGMEKMPPEKRRELVTSLERGTRRLTQLIDNLLESVRIESGQLAIRRQTVAIADVVSDAAAMVASLLAQRRQTLAVAVPEELPLLAGDRTRLTQVFVNLLANANKFAPEDSVVRIGAEAQPGKLIAWVEDEGPGPAGRDDATLFARFQRGGGAEPEPAGLGLGLWLVKSIIERHAGSVAFERTAAGRTRLTLTLPVETPP